MTFEELGIDIRTHRSGNQKVFCPNCHHQRKNKTDKSLSVKVSTGEYNCFNCGFHGVADGKTKDESKREWIEQMKQQKEYSKPVQIELPIGQTVIDWFKKRRITPETLQYFRISESTEWMPAKGEVAAGTRKVINFNYYRDNEKVNIKYRDHVKAFRMVKDAELILYNQNALRDRTDMLICEGEIDCMSFYQSGYFGATSVPNGAAKGSARLEFLDSLADVLNGMVKVIIATDDDEAGHYLRDELARRIGRDKCWFVTYPEGCKDANEVEQKHGAAAVRELWQNAYAPPLEHIVTESDLIDRLDDIYLNGWPETKKVGYRDFDDLLSWLPGQLTTFTGMPGHGKGEFLEQLTLRMATRCGWKIGYFSYEERYDIKAVRLCQKYVGRAFADSSLNKNPRMNPAQKVTASKFVAEHFFFIDTDNADITIDGIISKARELVLRKGINVFIIDPYTCIESRRGKHQSETEYIGEIMQKLTQFGSLYNVATFLVAHPTKMKKEKKGKYAVPTLYDIAGSANFFNKTHNGMCIYRDYSTNIVTVYVQKVKFGFCGKLGSVDFAFDVETGRYAEDGTAYESELEQQQRRQVQMNVSFASEEPPTVTVSKPTSPPPAAPKVHSFPEGVSADLSNWKAPLPADEVPF